MIPTIGKLKQAQFISLYFPSREFRYRYTTLFFGYLYRKLFFHVIPTQMNIHIIPFSKYQNNVLQIFILFDNPELSCKIYFFIYWDWSSYWVVPCWITLSDYFYPYFWILFKYFIKVFSFNQLHKVNTIKDDIWQSHHLQCHTHSIIAWV